jgi:hypothetical protein
MVTSLALVGKTGYGGSTIFKMSLDVCWTRRILIIVETLKAFGDG